MKNIPETAALLSNFLFLVNSPFKERSSSSFIIHFVCPLDEEDGESEVHEYEAISEDEPGNNITESEIGAGTGA